MKDHYQLLSVEENRYEIMNRFLSLDNNVATSCESINLSLISTLNHLIISFRTMSNINLTLDVKDSVPNKLQLHTLVLPCLPSTSESIDIFDFNRLNTLDIGHVNVKDRTELMRLNDIISCHCHQSLRNLTICLSDWQTARLVVLWNKEDNRDQWRNSTAQFISVFDNCFDHIARSEEDEEHKEEMTETTFSNLPSRLGKVSCFH